MKPNSLFKGKYTKKALFVIAPAILCAIIVCVLVVSLNDRNAQTEKVADSESPGIMSSERGDEEDMEKLYDRTYWQNAPDKTTPLNAENLDKMEAGIDGLDDRVVELNGTLDNVTDISTNIIDESKIENGFAIRADGEVVANPNYKICTEYIAVNRGDVITYKCQGVNDYNGVFAIQLYDESKKSLGRGEEAYSGNVKSYVVGSAKYIRFTFGINSTDIMVVKGDTLPPYKPYGLYSAIDTVARNKIDNLQNNGSLLVSKENDSINIYIPTAEGYTFYVFKHWTNTSAYADIWKLWKYGITDNTLNEVFSGEENIEWEGVVRETDGADFIGGYHGDETTTRIQIFIDGKFYGDTSADFTLKQCDKVEIVCCSCVYSYADHTTLLFNRYKTLRWDKNGMRIKNRWIAQTNSNLQIIYPVMMSLNREINELCIVAYGRYNDKYMIQELNPSAETIEGGCSNRSEYATITELWGDNLYAKCEIIKSDLPTPHKVMFVDRTNQENVAKMYYGYNWGNVEMTSGTEFESEALFTLQKPSN